MSLIKPAAAKTNLHPRNRHRDRYDFPALVRSSPELAAFVARNPHGDDSIDFAKPEAVKALNRALLRHFYDVAEWDVPEGYLCPPIPGRADYLHYAADLLAGKSSSSRGGEIPRGPGVRVLDVGVGANCIYPILGHREYGWSFVGTDIDRVALESARAIVAANPGLPETIELRLQDAPPKILAGVVRPTDRFDLVICNPPFHASLEEAQEGSRRKWKGLGKEKLSRANRGDSPVANFGGQGSELWTPGGELAFIRRLIDESAGFGQRCRWFSTLVSKGSNLSEIEFLLQEAGAVRLRLFDMSQGQKKSRIAAWTFHETAAWPKDAL